MLPEIIQQIITFLGRKFTPDATKKFYDDYVSVWELYLSLFELDKTRIITLLEKHDAEADPQYKLRQELAAVFNYVPSIVRMVVNYLYTEQPQITVADKDLQTFLDNCDGSGTPFTQYVKHSVL